MAGVVFCGGGVAREVILCVLLKKFVNLLTAAGFALDRDDAGGLAARRDGAGWLAEQALRED